MFIFLHIDMRLNYLLWSQNTDAFHSLTQMGSHILINNIIYCIIQVLEDLFGQYNSLIKPRIKFSLGRVYYRYPNFSFFHIVSRVLFSLTVKCFVMVITLAYMCDYYFDIWNQDTYLQTSISYLIQSMYLGHC